MTKIWLDQYRAPYAIQLASFIISIFQSACSLKTFNVPSMDPVRGDLPTTLTNRALLLRSITELSLLSFRSPLVLTSIFCTPVLRIALALLLLRNLSSYLGRDASVMDLPNDQSTLSTRLPLFLV